MARVLLATTAFEWDLRRMRRQGKDLDKLGMIVDLLQQGRNLPARRRPHSLRGAWKGRWDCHVEPDWVLLCRLAGEATILARTGSHAELFG